MYFLFASYYAIKQQHCAFYSDFNCSLCPYSIGNSRWGLAEQKVWEIQRTRGGKRDRNREEEKSEGDTQRGRENKWVLLSSFTAVSPGLEKENQPLCNMSNLCSGAITHPVTELPHSWLSQTFQRSHAFQHSHYFCYSTTIAGIRSEEHTSELQSR